jgi:lysophospholipase L1-like esterase
MTRTRVTRTAASRTATTRSWTKGGNVLVAGDSLSLGSDGDGGTIANRFAVQVQTYLATTYSGTWNLLAPGGAGGLAGTSGALRISSAGWSYTTPYRLAIFEISINNRGGNAAYPSGTYADDDEAEAAYGDDIAAMVTAVTSFACLPVSHVLLLGMMPNGDRHQNGTAENAQEFRDWNNIIVPAAVAATGATFVPMADVYGEDYNPNPYDAETRPLGDPMNYFPVDSTHPNEAGHTCIANRIIEYIPDLTRPHRATV